MKKMPYLVLIIVSSLALLSGVLMSRGRHSVLYADAVWISRPKSVSFNLVENQILVPVKFGDSDGLAILDNGVDLMIIDEALTRSLGARVAGRMRVNGEAAALADDIPYQIGPVIITPRKSIVADVTALTISSTANVGAVVGRPLFNNAAVGIDFEHGLITIEKSAMFRPGQDMTSHEIKEIKNAIAIDVSVNGMAECAMLDLGSNEALTINPEYARRRKLDVVGVSGSATSLGKALTVEGRARIDNVDIMGVTYSSILGTVLSGKNYRGCSFIVGAELLKRYNIVFAVEKNMIFASPNPLMEASFHKRDVPNVPQGG